MDDEPSFRWNVQVKAIKYVYRFLRLSVRASKIFERFIRQNDNSFGHLLCDTDGNSSVENNDKFYRLHRDQLHKLRTREKYCHKRYSFKFTVVTSEFSLCK